MFLYCHFLTTKYNLEEGEFLKQKVQKQIRASGENRTHDPLSFSSDALTTEFFIELEGPREKTVDFGRFAKKTKSWTTTAHM